MFSMLKSFKGFGVVLAIDFDEVPATHKVFKVKMVIANWEFFLSDQLTRNGIDLHTRVYVCINMNSILYVGN